jgi:hypothetical protein
MKVLEVERRDWETVRHGMASCISGARQKKIQNAVGHFQILLAHTSILHQ